MDYLRIMYKSLSGHWLSGLKFCGVSSVLPDYELTTYMEQSNSWEANSLSASQENPRVLWNPKVYYRIHKSSPEQSSPWPHPTYLKCIWILFSHLSLGFPSGLFPLVFLTKILCAPFLFPCVLNAPPISFSLIWS